MSSIERHLRRLVDPIGLSQSTPWPLNFDFSAIPGQRRLSMRRADFFGRRHPRIPRRSSTQDVWAEGLHIASHRADFFSPKLVAYALHLSRSAAAADMQARGFHMKHIDLDILSLLEGILEHGAEGEAAFLRFVVGLADEVCLLLEPELPWDVRPRRALTVLRLLSIHPESVNRNDIWKAIDEMDALCRWNVGGVGCVSFHAAKCLHDCLSAAWEQNAAERARIFLRAIRQGEAAGLVSKLRLSAHERLEAELNEDLSLLKTAARDRLVKAVEILSGSGGPKSSAGDGHDPRLP